MNAARSLRFMSRDAFCAKQEDREGSQTHKRLREEPHPTIMAAGDGLGRVFTCNGSSRPRKIEFAPRSAECNSFRAGVVSASGVYTTDLMDNTRISTNGTALEQYPQRGPTVNVSETREWHNRHARTESGCASPNASQSCAFASSGTAEHPFLHDVVSTAGKKESEILSIKKGFADSGVPPCHPRTSVAPSGVSLGTPFVSPAVPPVPEISEVTQ